MRKLSVAVIVAITLGAGAAALANVEPAGKRRCANTWCAPGDSKCYELEGWSCRLSGGCAGTTRCDQEAE